jgi:DNA-binding transcriptional LysR family regulator
VNQLLAMRNFVEIVDQGSLTAAASSSGRSLPAVVRSLAALEQHLGVRLLRRTTRQMSLTSEGRDYLASCRQILSDVKEAESSLAAGQIAPQGEIRLTAPVLFGQLHLAPALTGFLKEFREVKVRLLLLDRVADLVDEGFDLALRIGELHDSAMSAIGVGHMRRVVCASPSFLEQHGPIETPGALKHAPCLLHGASPGDHGHWRFTKEGGGFNVAVRGPFSCSQALVVANAAADGIGIAQLLHYQVADLVGAGKLCIILDNYEVAPVPVSLLYPEARRVTARVRHLVKWLRVRLSQRLEGMGHGSPNTQRPII